mgnify:CR=1 FL=1
MERHRLELVGPVIVGEDRLELVLATLQGMALLEGVLDQLLHHLRMEGVEDVEEVLPVTLPSFGVRVRKELGHPLELDELVVEALDRELVVLGHGDELDHGQLHHALLAAEDVPEHVLGQHVVGHQVVLAETTG